VALFVLFLIFQLTVGGVDSTHIPNILNVSNALPLPRKRSPDGASPDGGCGHLIAANYSFIYHERMKG